MLFCFKRKNDSSMSFIIIQQRSKEIFEQQTLYYLEEKEIKSKGKLIFYSKIKRKYKKELSNYKILKIETVSEI